MNTNFREPKKVDQTTEKKDPSKREIQHPSTKGNQTKVHAIPNSLPTKADNKDNMNLPFLSNSNNKIVAQKDMTDQTTVDVDAGVQFTERIMGSIQRTIQPFQFVDSIERKEKKSVKSQSQKCDEPLKTTVRKAIKKRNIKEKYVTNRSTNKYFLETFSKIKKNLSKNDKELFSVSVKNWFQIEMKKLSSADDVSNFPIEKLIK